MIVPAFQDPTIATCVKVMMSATSVCAHDIWLLEVCYWGLVVDSDGSQTCAYTSWCAASSVLFRVTYFDWYRQDFPQKHFHKDVEHKQPQGNFIKKKQVKLVFKSGARWTHKEDHKSDHLMLNLTVFSMWWQHRNYSSSIPSLSLYICVCVRVCLSISMWASFLSSSDISWCLKSKHHCSFTI